MIDERTSYVTYKISDEVQSNNSINMTLFKDYGIKRGLRNEDGTGVLAGLTNICDVVGYVKENDKIIPVNGDLIIRGHSISTQIARGFENMIYLLLSGNIPSHDDLSNFKKLLRSKMVLDPKTILNIIELEGNDIMNTLARSILELYVFDENADATDRDNLIRQSVDLIAKIPMIIAYSYNIYRYKNEGRTYHMRIPMDGVSIAENFLLMIKGREYTKEEVDILDTMLCLHCEHGGGNNSTFTVRVTSSSGTDTYSSIAAGIGSLKGPKHGGANIQVKKMIDDIKAHINDWNNCDEIRQYIDKILARQAFDKSGLVYGVGHAVYTLSDPRAVILKEKARSLAEIKGCLNEYEFMERLERIATEAVNEKTGKIVCANVDFWSGFVYGLIDIPAILFTPLFAMARVVGWCAHRNEELCSEGARIIRPAYKYIKS